MELFDISPFRLPRTPASEFWFEESRDIARVVLTFKAGAVSQAGIAYQHKCWPENRFEKHHDRESPVRFGWQPMDDWFNGHWRDAGIIRRTQGQTVQVSFKPLATDGFPEVQAKYDVTFRRTLAVKITGVDMRTVATVRIFSRSAPARTGLRIQLDAGRRTPGRSLRLEGYNTRITEIHPGPGIVVKGPRVTFRATPLRVLEIFADHMVPVHAYSNDAGHITVRLDHDAFTFGLQDLTLDGGIWIEPAGLYITRTDAPVSFADYRARFAGRRTRLQEMAARGDHSFGAAFLGQPRGHAVNYNVGCKLAPQRYWIEANGDIFLNSANLEVAGNRGARPVPQFKNKGSAKFFFGFERWIPCARFTDPAPAPLYNMRFKNETLLADLRFLAVPLRRPIEVGELTFHEPTVCLMRIVFTNAGDAPVQAVLPLGYSQDSCKSGNGCTEDIQLDEYAVPLSPRDPVTLTRGRIVTPFNNQPVVRGLYDTTMKPGSGARRRCLCQILKPGESCTVVLKIPHATLTNIADEQTLARLDFVPCDAAVTRFWRADLKGCRLHTPVPALQAVHDSHVMHQDISDVTLPDDPRLISTSVGTNTYANFINESIMIIQDLDQRGLVEAVRRRLQVFVRYQGTATQPGNFTDFEGALYGAGGWECGSYNQHHGWALWYLAEHFLLTRDKKWFTRVAETVVAGADWVFRQRRTTRGNLSHSRGWERGWLPAGSLEDVTEYYYWLSTNCLTWRGTDAAACALEAFGHPQAARVRRESDAYARDLRRGLARNRQQAPVVRLRDGRWVPHFPSRLYCRGRDFGWIREVLEGAVYLLISGLYKPESREADWILNDYQDNLYHTPPYGYVLRDPDVNIRTRGGFSIQPNLLAGLLPHLDRDEPEIYQWMFFNAWAACYREEITGMIEHPMPELGWANAATFKTSDEANAMMWLRYLMVYAPPDGLFLGRAMPRAWLLPGPGAGVRDMATRWGRVSVEWKSNLDLQGMGTLVLTADLRGPQDAPRVIARFRHPTHKPIRSVTLNGKSRKSFDAQRGDVDVTGQKGKWTLIATY